MQTAEPWNFVFYAELVDGAGSKICTYLLLTFPKSINKNAGNREMIGKRGSLSQTFLLLR